MSTHAQYISASRRNDLPRFHSEAFFDAWSKGQITYDGGYGRSYTVSLRQEDVLGYIFWSKDFSRFIEHRLFADLIGQSNAVFHFTINTMPDLEPNVPSVDKRSATLARLCDAVGPQRVFWRFDPICTYVDARGKAVTTENGFFELLPHIQKTGITRCYFSFMTLYKKLDRRSLRFLPFADEEKKTIGGRLLRGPGEAGLTLYNCCNDGVLRLVPGVKQAHCVDDEILRETDRFGVHTPLKPAPTRPGCGCRESRDIGSYEPACAHGCLYCYANPHPGSP